MRVAFRVDASVETGSGHVMRCLALAETLRQSAAEAVFVARQHPGDLCEAIRRKGFEVRALPVAERVKADGMRGEGALSERRPGSDVA